MRTTTKVIIATATAVIAVAGVGIGVTATGGGQDDGPDVPITGSALDSASAAALAHTGGGRVTGTEVDDEESYYEVEVTLDDGSQVDVQLDRGFEVVGSSADVED
jgi:uncharacterized membrane protein YkoI